MRARAAVGTFVGRRVLRKVAKSVPVVGTAVSVALLAHSVRRKGWVGGLVHSTLDAIPFIGAFKNAVEIFTGDLVPDLPAAPAERADISLQAAPPS